LVAIACAVTVPITAVTGMTTEASPNWIGDQPSTSWAYWVRMNGTPKPVVPSANSTRLPPTSDRERNTPSGASGATERFSMPTNTTISTAARASRPSVCPSAQPALGASTTA
jgi:hypothetical protein